MNAAVLGRDYLIGAITGVAPHLVTFFEAILVKEFYTVNELNTLMRYELIKLSPNTMEIRDWLCDSPDTNVWVYYFCQRVVPFISDTLRYRFQSPDCMLEALAG